MNSALDFLGRFTQPAKDTDIGDAAKIFAWVPDIICRRAEASGKPKNAYVLAAPKSSDACNTLAMMLRIAIGDMQPGAAPSPDAHEANEEWLEKRLAGLERSERYVRTADGWEWRKVPVLLSVEHCLLYAIAILHQDSWKLRERVRLCPYRARRDSPTHFEPEHWFLDFEVDEHAALKLGPPQQFCTGKHGNAFRQREWRKQQAAAKHK